MRDWIELAVLPILSAAVFVLWDLNKNVSQLNVQVGVMLSETSNTKETLKFLQFEQKELEARVREMEKGKKI